MGYKEDREGLRMGKPLGPVIDENTRIKCLNCEKEGVVSNFWCLSRYSFEQIFVFCDCDRDHPLAVIFPDDGRIEINTDQAVVVKRT